MSDDDIRDNGFIFARLGAGNVANVRPTWLTRTFDPWPLDVFAHIPTRKAQP